MVITCSNCGGSIDVDAARDVEQTDCPPTTNDPAMHIVVAVKSGGRTWLAHHCDIQDN